MARIIEQWQGSHLDPLPLQWRISIAIGVGAEARIALIGLAGARSREKEQTRFGARTLLNGGGHLEAHRTRMSRKRLPPGLHIGEVQLPEATRQIEVALLMLALVQINDIADRFGGAKGARCGKIGKRLEMHLFRCGIPAHQERRRVDLISIGTAHDDDPLRCRCARCIGQRPRQFLIGDPLFGARKQHVHIIVPHLAATLGQRCREVGTSCNDQNPFVGSHQRTTEADLGGHIRQQGEAQPGRLRRLCAQRSGGHQ